MISRIVPGTFILLLLLNATDSFAETEVFELSLQDAEIESLGASNQLKSFISDVAAATEQANSQFAELLPQLSLEANYKYLSEVPDIPVQGQPPFPFGSHNNYSVGAVLRYTLWDTGTSRKAYQGLAKLAASRQEDRKTEELQILLSVRTAYVRVQLALEELRLVNDTLELSRAQDRDIATRYRAGAATRLDLVTSERDVIGYELQFKQKQADLSVALKDLLALLGSRSVKDVSHPGPPNVDGVSLILKLNPFQKLLTDEGQAEIPPPDDRQPQIRSRELLAESSELSAASQKAELFPTVQFSARTSLDYPNGPILEQINQNTVFVGLSMPLFDGNRIRHLVAQNLMEAQSARYRKDQLMVDIQRDFAKARELLDSLREQQKLAKQDVLRSEEAARLYYESYKAGSINLIDVQSANVRALLAKVSAARIDAQILNQLFILKALSGRELGHE